MKIGFVIGNGPDGSDGLNDLCCFCFSPERREASKRSGVQVDSVQELKEFEGHGDCHPEGPGFYGGPAVAGEEVAHPCVHIWSNVLLGNFHHLPSVWVTGVQKDCTRKRFQTPLQACAHPRICKTEPPGGSRIDFGGLVASSDDSHKKH